MKFWRKDAIGPVGNNHGPHESEAGLKRLFDAMVDPVVAVVVKDGRCLYRNTTFMTRGYSCEEVLGKRFADLGIWASEGVTFDQFVESQMAQGFVRGEQVNLRLGSGSVVPHSISSALMDFGDEKCVVLICRGVSSLTDDRKAAAVSVSKSDFLTDLSHEIRTPLNTILGMADLLSEGQLSIESRKFVDAMVANGNTLLDLINSVLDLDKIETGRLGLEYVAFDIEELLDYVAGTAGARAHLKGVEIVSRMMPDVPKRVVGDPLRLRQILLNLICNAVESTDCGEVVLSVEKGQDAADDPETLRFIVSDTGVGIPPDRVSRIMHSFTESGQAVRSSLGISGLGLSIAKGLIELMGGHIDVQSEIGKGSTFSFSVRMEAPDGIAIEDHPYADAQLGGSRVLVVDDNANNRKKIKAILSGWGAQITEAEDGETALTAWREARDSGNPHKLVLMDCDLPNMDGFEAARLIRETSTYDPRVIMMLNLNELNSKVALARSVGINDYIVKPITRGDLYSGVTLALGLKAAAVGKTTAPEAHRQVAPRRLRILLAEDSSHNCMVVKAYLKNTSYELDIAEDGAGAVKSFITGNYDLVLMDVRMPVMDGYEATRRIRKWELEQGRMPTPIVALTASALEQDMQQSMEAGCTAHVSKPVKKTLLLATIRDMIEADSNVPSDGDCISPEV